MQKTVRLKGGGAIDFFARLNDLSAKEASHILACAYRIQPYPTEELPEVKGTKSETEMQTFKKNGSSNRARPEQIKDGEYVTRQEFADLNDRPGYGYRKSGVILLGLQPQTMETRRLFDDDRYQRDRVLMSAIDQLNSRHGRKTVRFGLFVTDRAKWQLSRNHLSPSFTTNLGQILRIYN